MKSFDFFEMIIPRSLEEVFTGWGAFQEYSNKEMAI